MKTSENLHSKKNSLIVNSASITLLFFLFLLLLFNLPASAQFNRKSTDTLACLEITGKVLNAFEGEDASCRVELINKGDVIDSVILKEGKDHFHLILSKDQYYAIRISKKGYVPRILEINTTMFVELDGLYTFHFNTELISDKLAKKLNQDALDFPIAIIYFNHDEDCFDYSREYTETLKNEMFTGGKKQN